MVDLALQNIDLASAAQAMIAGIGQPDTGAQCAVEHALAILQFEGFAQGLYGQSKTHVSLVAGAMQAIQTRRAELDVTHMANAIVCNALAKVR